MKFTKRQINKIQEIYNKSFPIGSIQTLEKMLFRVWVILGLFVVNGRLLDIMTKNYLFGKG